MQALKEYIKDKSVAIVGNAKSILYNKKDIDKHDIIVRMNMADPREHKEYMGSITDIWATGLPQRKALEAYRALKFELIVIVHAAWKPQVIDPERNFIIYEYPESSQAKLQAKEQQMGGNFPSTGLRTIDMFVGLGSYKELYIYGFDFFATGDITTESTAPTTHYFNLEKEIVREFMSKDKRIIFHKDEINYKKDQERQSWLMKGSVK